MKTLRSAGHQALRRALIEARNQAGLTQAELAKKLGQPQSFVAKIEGGERKLEVVEFVRVAKVLAVEPYSIIEKVAQAEADHD